MSESKFSKLSRCPLPFARAYVRFIESENEEDRYTNACNLFEVYIKYSAALCVSAYLDGEIRDNSVNSTLRSLVQPALSDWLNILNSTISFLVEPSNKTSAFVENIHNSIFIENNEPASFDKLFNALRTSCGSNGSETVDTPFSILEKFAAFRTTVKPAELSDSDRAELAVCMKDAFEDLVKVSTFFQSAQLCSVTSGEPRMDSATEYKTIFLSGLDIEHGSDPVVYKGDGEPPVPGRIYIWQESGPAWPLPTLHPLLLLNENDVYFLSTGLGPYASDIEYISYSTGKTYRPDSLGQNKLDAILNIDVSADGEASSKEKQDTAACEKAPGHVIGDYEIIRELGRGAMGIVYEAFRRSLKQRVALKVLPAELIRNTSQIKRFKREAQAAANITHPNIVPVYDVGEEAGTYYFAMKLIHGASLAKNIKNAKQSDSTGSKKKSGSTTTTNYGYITHVVDQMARVAEGLECAHESGMIHRDIKPSNIMVDEKGTYHLVDFGLVRDLGEQDFTTKTGLLLGTIPYMAPESFFNRKTDTQADIYSMGATLYEALTLNQPFKGNSDNELLDNIRYNDPPKPRRINPKLPRDIQTIILKSLEKNPRHRYETAKAFAQDLRRFLNYEPIKARPTSFVRRTMKWGRRHPVTTAVSATVIVCALVVYAVVMLSMPVERGKRDLYITSEPAGARITVTKIVKDSSTASPEESFEEEKYAPVTVHPSQGIYSIEAKIDGFPPKKTMVTVYEGEDPAPIEFKWKSGSLEATGTSGLTVNLFRLNDSGHYEQTRSEMLPFPGPLLLFPGKYHLKASIINHYPIFREFDIVHGNTITDKLHPSLIDWQRILTFDSPLSRLRVIDLEGDGFPEIFGISRDHQLMLFQHNGRKRLEEDLGGPCDILKYADLNGDGSLEIIAANSRGKAKEFQVLSPDGTYRSLGFKTEIESIDNLIPVDLDNDLKPEIIATVISSKDAEDERFRVYEFRKYGGLTLILLSSDGKEIFKREMDGWIAKVEAKDVNDDGFSEIIASSETGLITILSHKGKTLFQVKTNAEGKLAGFFNTADFNGDGTLELCIRGNDDNLYSYDPDAYKTDGVSPTSLISKIQGLQGNITTHTICDLDNDGKYEIIACEIGGYISVFKGNSEKLFDSVKTHGEVCLIKTADINGNGLPEIIAGTDRGQILVLNQKGGKLFEDIIERKVIQILPIQIFKGTGSAFLVETELNNIFVFGRRGGNQSGIEKILDMNIFSTILNIFTEDIDGDGIEEILIAKGQKKRQIEELSVVYPYASRKPDASGNEEDTSVNGEIISFASFDINGDKKPEVVVRTERGRLFCFDNTYRTIFDIGLIQQNSPFFGPSITQITDINGNGGCEIIDTRAGKITVFDAKGSQLFSKNGLFLGIADLKDDNKYRSLIVCDYQNGIYAFDCKGRNLFDKKLQEGTPSSKALAEDLDGDGSSEFFMSFEQRAFGILDEKGFKELYQVTLNDQITLMRYAGLPFAQGLIVDLKGDGQSEFLVNISNTGLTAINREGNRRIVCESDPGLLLITKADLENDGKPELFFHFKSNKISVRGIDNVERFSFDAEKQFLDNRGKSFVTSDITGDGNPELILYTQSGKVIAYDQSGKPLFEKQAGEPINKRRDPHDYSHLTDQVLTADVNGDGISDVIVLSKNRITACDHAGREVMSVKDLYIDIAAADFNEDGKHEILGIGGDGKIMMLKNSSGELFYDLGDIGSSSSKRQESLYNIYNIPIMITADLDGDGKPEVVSSTPDNKLIVLENDGKPRFRADLKDAGRGISKIHSANVAGDERLEIVVLTRLGRLIVFSRDGSLCFQSEDGNFVGRFIDSGDMNNDGTAELIVFVLNNKIVKTDDKGRILNQYLTGRQNISPFFAADIGGGNEMEILASTNNSIIGRKFEIQAFDKDLNPIKEFGSIKVKALGKGTQVMDLDKDGENEIPAITEDGSIITLSRNGIKSRSDPSMGGSLMADNELISNPFIDFSIFSGLIPVADLDNDGAYEIMAFVDDNRAMKSKLSILDADLELVSQISVDNPQPSGKEFRKKTLVDRVLDRIPSISIKDIDVDGSMEIVFRNRGLVCAINADGKKRFDTKDKGYVTDFSLADLDNNGTLEVIVRTIKGNLKVLDNMGTMVYQTHPGKKICRFCTSDLNGDGKVEVIVASAGGNISTLDVNSYFVDPLFKLKKTFMEALETAEAFNEKEAVPTDSEKAVSRKFKEASLRWVSVASEDTVELAERCLACKSPSAFRQGVLLTNHLSFNDFLKLLKRLVEPENYDLVLKLVSYRKYEIAGNEAFHKFIKELLVDEKNRTFALKLVEYAIPDQHKASSKAFSLKAGMLFIHGRYDEAEHYLKKSARAAQKRSASRGKDPWHKEFKDVIRSVLKKTEELEIKEIPEEFEGQEKVIKAYLLTLRIIAEEDDTFLRHLFQLHLQGELPDKFLPTTDKALKFFREELRTQDPTLKWFKRQEELRKTAPEKLDRKAEVEDLFGKPLTYAAIDTALDAPDFLIVEGDEWRFFRGKKEPSPDPDSKIPTLDWTKPDYDDTGWKTGPSGFGYGDDDDNTELEDMSGNYTTLYVRRSFDISDPKQYKSIVLSIKVDDGYAAYLNGQEIGYYLIWNPTGEPISHNEIAWWNIIDPETTEMDLLKINSKILQTGPNVLSIQCFNRKLTSTDLSMIPVVFGIPAHDPERDGALFKRFCESQYGTMDTPHKAYFEGRILQRKGRYEQALSKFEEAFAKEENASQSIAGIVKCLRSLGKAKAAQERLQKALRGKILYDTDLWNLWFAVSAIDLKQSVHQMRAFLEKRRLEKQSKILNLVSSYPEDILWVLEQLDKDDSIRINCGGNESGMLQEKLWGRDRFYLSGRKKETKEVTENNKNMDFCKDSIYECERFFPRVSLLPLGYSIPLPSGRYHVNLYFLKKTNYAEYFDVAIEGKTVLHGYSLFLQKSIKPDSFKHETEAKDGFLDIRFFNRSRGAKISGIEIMQLKK